MNKNVYDIVNSLGIAYCICFCFTSNQFPINQIVKNKYGHFQVKSEFFFALWYGGVVSRNLPDGHA